MEALIASLKIVLANTFEMYFKAHGHHWNIEGVHFHSMHDFFSDLYEELHGAVDPIAEELRKLDAFAPYGSGSVIKHKTVMGSEIYGTQLTEMLDDLLTANLEVVSSLNTALTHAKAENREDLVNFLAGRLEIHNKHGWMLRASLKTL
jgi:starvation-inducible DNA-binding protein